MCLKLKDSSTFSKQAEEDIICYKRIMVEDIFDGSEYDGKEFKGTIKGIECTGKISIDDYDSLYFCTDDPKLRGAACDETYGYKYSWFKDCVCKNIIIDGKPLNQQLQYITPYRKYPIEIGKTYTSDLVCNEYNEVEIGLHSYINKQDAFDDVNRNGFVVKCIIPKGSKYYKGFFGHEPVPSYASDCITYVEIVNMGSYVNLI